MGRLVLKANNPIISNKRHFYIIVTILGALNLAASITILLKLYGII